MDWIYHKLKGKNKLIWAKSELKYEESIGIYTYHQCKCKKKMCRSNMCTLCWKEEINKLNTID